MKMSFLDDYEVTKVAFSLVTGTIKIATAMIERDEEGVFVYINPLFADPQPAAGRAEYQQDLEQSNLSVSTAVKSDSSEEQIKKPRTLAAAGDSRSSLESHAYSYIFNPPQLRSSVTPSVRVTLESDGFRNNLKPAAKEQMWNYVMSDVSSENEEYLVENSEQDILHMQQLVYEWPTVGEFTLDDTLHVISRFVGLWKLSFNTKFALLRNTAATKGCLGERYYVTVAFSKPTKRCPNPLAVAYVNFQINYSYVMPQYFPIMVTYCFETYNQSYHVLGAQNMRSISFQNYYIETILNAKLSFYAQIYETTYGSLNEKMTEYSVDEEYEMFKRQAEIDLSECPESRVMGSLQYNGLTLKQSLSVFGLTQPESK